MAETPRHDPRSPGAQLDQRSQQLVTAFEKAWKQALQDGDPPKVDSYLAELPSDARPHVRERLARIDGEHRQRWQERKSADQPPHAKETTLQSIDPTVLLPSPDDAQPSSSVVDATVNLQDQESVAKSVPAATIELSGSEISDDEIACTMDPEGSNSDSDLRVSWDSGDQLKNAKPKKKDKRVPLGDADKVPGYEIHGELGRGGMGVVYHASQRSLKRQVALKMILSGGHAGSDQIARFRAEAEAVAQLQHQNIVQIYEVGEQNGLPYFSLEFVDGHSLDKEIDRQPQEPLRASEIVEQLANAMFYAHSQGIVHRDLKPANILLTRDGVPKISDFGLVKRIESDSSQTRTGTIMGTPSYMAPEQGRGDKDVGPPADVYALGSILYTMLTGRPPFMGPTAMDTLMQVLKTEPVPPSRLQPKIPRDIEIICLKCLQKEPPKRYESAKALAEDLRRFRVGMPILARRVGTAERLWRWCRRNPKMATLSGAAAVLALALMIGGPTAALVINEQRKLAVEAQTLADANATAARTAQRDAEAAKKDADTNAEIAKQQRQVALDTLNRVVTQVEEELHDRAELNDLRQTVLNLAMEGLDLVSRTSDNALLADRMVGAAHQRMADILFRAGKIDEARGQYSKGLAIFEKLVDPEIHEHDLARWNAALTCDGLGDVGRKQMEDATGVRDMYQKALEYRQYLQTIETSEKLKPVMVRASLANSYGRLSLLLLELMGDPQQAADYSQLAVDEGEALRKDLSDNPVALQLLAGAFNLHAEALLHLGNTDEAFDYAQRAFELREQYYNAMQQSVKARQDLAVSNWMLGDIALLRGDPRKTLEHFEAAHVFRIELFESDRNNPEMWEDLGNSWYRLGTVHLELQQMAEAENCFQQCLQLRQDVLNVDPANASKKIQFLLAQARCGQAIEAAKGCDALRESLFPNPGTLLRLAGIYAVCSATAQSQDTAAVSTTDVGNPAQEYRELSMQLLHDAVERGLRDRVVLTMHPDLASLRNDPSFAQVLAQIDAAIAP